MEQVRNKITSTINNTNSVSEATNENGGVGEGVGGIKEAKSREIVHVKPVRKLELSVGETGETIGGEWKGGKERDETSGVRGGGRGMEGRRVEDARNCVFI